ncbi:MAG TPA: phosphatidate cytidylyltransferase [Dongiaceae bacterium]|nr:phosphatidate cytidylyltransferase [Dongiaceae bacterium]
MAAPAEQPPKRASSLTLRIISAAVLIPIVAAAAYLGHPWWDLLVILFGVVMIWEWCRIAGRRRDPDQPAVWLPEWDPVVKYIGVVTVLAALSVFTREGWAALWSALIVGALIIAALAFTPRRSAALWGAPGLFYVAVPCAAIIWLRADASVGLPQILWIVALVIAVDTGAYAAGRSIGGPKLAPRISPNKTWAGLVGGVLSAAIVGAITAAILGRPSLAPLTAVSAGLALVEQAGDLAESAFKRHFGVKDASNIIPGHGGALDRVDGLIAVAAAVAGINALIGSSVLTWL